jgi:hypothetical protein
MESFQVQAKGIANSVSSALIQEGKVRSTFSRLQVAQRWVLTSMGWWLWFWP